jgi:hypothetical protein
MQKSSCCFSVLIHFEKEMRQSSIYILAGAARVYICDFFGIVVTNKSMMIRQSRLIKKDTATPHQSPSFCCCCFNQ